MSETTRKRWFWIRPLAADREVPPSSLDELWVGTTTAREIGWLK
jgi:hypothetical protein